LLEGRGGREREKNHRMASAYRARSFAKERGEVLTNEGRERTIREDKSARLGRKLIPTAVKRDLENGFVYNTDLKNAKKKENC